MVSSEPEPYAVVTGTSEISGEVKKNNSVDASMTAEVLNCEVLRNKGVRITVHLVEPSCPGY